MINILVKPYKLLDMPQVTFPAYLHLICFSALIFFSFISLCVCTFDFVCLTDSTQIPYGTEQWPEALGNSAVSRGAHIGGSNNNYSNEILMP